MNLTRTHKTLAVVVLLLLATILVGVMYIRSPAFQVAYHTRHMNRAYDAHYAEPEEFQVGMIAHVYGEDYERFEYHRDQLIALGAVDKIRYKFQHLQQTTDECTHFIRFILVQENIPSCIEWTGDPANPEQLEPFLLTVWCFPDSTAAWNDLNATRDIPDYESTFMNEENPRAN